MADSKRILKVQPQVFVTDMERALSFYCDGLGFGVEYTYGDPPSYGLVSRDGCGLNLRHVDRLPWDVARAQESDLLSASFVVTGLAELHDELRGRDLAFHQALEERPWGPDFIVTDPDGNLIHFVS